MNLNKIRKQYKDAKVAYYYGTPIMTDQEFDLLEIQLKHLSPDDELLKLVGCDLPRESLFTKVKHDIPMSSLDNSRDEKEFREWHTKCGGGPVHISLKQDGCSVEIQYEKGLYKKAITRGDGIIGEDVSANAISFRNLPTMLPSRPYGEFTGSIRGEAQLSTELWKKIQPDWNEPGHNPRNCGNGILRRKDDNSGCFDIDFMAFDIISADEDYTTEVAKTEALKSLGFATPEWKLCNTADEVLEYYKDVIARRGSLEYWIDGIVGKINDIETQVALGMSNGRPKGQTAFKFPFEGVETKVNGVVITVGHTGALIPKATLDPVPIAGTIVKAAVLHNWDIIKELDVAIGDTVLVEKAGEIIPRITGVVYRPSTRKPIAEPKQCPVCGAATGREILSNGRHGSKTTCLADNCTAKTVDRKLKNWITKLEIIGIGDAVREAIIDQMGVTEISDLYMMDVAKLASITFEAGSELGRKRAEAIITELKNKNNVTLELLLGSIGIKHLGRRKVQLIREAVPGEFDTLADWLDNAKLLKFASQAHIPSIAQTIIKDIQSNKTLINSLVANHVVLAKNSTSANTKGNNMSGTLVNEVIVFTGKIEKCDANGVRYTRKAMEQLASENGAKIGSDVNSNTTMLVTADVNSTSSKMKTAQKLGCKIVSEKSFWDLIDKQ